MVKDVTDFEELPQGCGRLYVRPLPMDRGPVRVGAQLSKTEQPWLSKLFER